MPETVFFVWRREEWGWKRGLWHVFAANEGKNVPFYTQLYRKITIFQPHASPFLLK